MTRVRRFVASARQAPGRGEGGFTLTEMLISVTIMMAVTGAVFQLLNPAQGTFQAQPEVADMQQRMRVAVDSVTKDLVMAGAGTYTGSSAGALYNYFAPVMPYRKGDVSPDPPGTFRTDTVTLLYVPPTPSQTTIRDDMPRPSAQLKVNAQSNCPPNKHDALCGFSAGMRVLIFDQSGAWDAITITSVQDEALHLGHDGNLSVSYKAGSQITQVATHTYYLKEDAVKKTYELRHYDGYKTDLPVVDNVVSLEFEYFGEPSPPQLIPNKSLTSTFGPWTTYGPKPPPLGSDNANDSWPPGANCTFAVVDGRHTPRLASLGPAVTQVKLEPAILTDGPWCADDQHEDRYDADLLRIRRVRMKLRVQAAANQLRGPAGLLFKHGGTSTSSSRFVPDHEIRFDITPRNMNLGR